MRAPIRFAITATALLAAAPALAHPGHGENGGFVAGLLHPLTGFDHLAVMLLVGLWAAFAFPRAPLALPAAFMGGLTLGFATGIAMPGLSVEPAVALSLPVLAIALLAGTRIPRAAAIGLTALFAIGHGYAHASEATGDSLAFACGMLAATAMLHGIGLLIGMRLSGGGRRVGAAR